MAERAVRIGFDNALDWQTLKFCLRFLCVDMQKSSLLFIGYLSFYPAALLAYFLL